MSTIHKQMASTIETNTTSTTSTSTPSTSDTPQEDTPAVQFLKAHGVGFTVHQYDYLEKGGMYLGRRGRRGRREEGEGRRGRGEGGERGGRGEKGEERGESCSLLFVGTTRSSSELGVDEHTVVKTLVFVCLFLFLLF
jgi:hypothetical protein